jgi:hypothetical protein
MRKEIGLMKYDRIVIGAGIYGLYAAELCAKKGYSVLILEFDDSPFSRATYINQARVHLGYHYPRSYSTAVKSAKYFQRFVEEYPQSINSEYESIYGISKNLSWTNAEQFEKFCFDAGIPCDAVSSKKYFKNDLCEGTFLTKEFVYDANILLENMLSSALAYSSITIRFNTKIANVNKSSSHFEINMENGDKFVSGFVINATYASTNQVSAKFGYPLFKIKYELCEIILCTLNDNYRNLGFTVMDGPFFSIIPFGKTNLHSLTSVTFTPHKASFEDLPTFDCQQNSKGYCSPEQLGNCNKCIVKPKTAWNYMSALARKYLQESCSIEYIDSLFSMKPILRASEIDDSRPTVIRQHSAKPVFISVLSGKINTIYDLEGVLV